MRIGYPTRIISSASQISLLFHFPKTLTKIIPKTLHESRVFSVSTPQSSPTSTMAGESESVSATADDSAKFGFERSEMYQSNLAGTVDPYDRHLFLCYKSHKSWPSRVENSDSDPLPKQLATALKTRKNDISIKTRLTICEGGDDVKLSDGDVLIFPEMIICRGLKESDVDGFIEDVLVSGKPWSSGVQEELTGSYVFVCAHKNRDRRCGVCGPVLIDTFKKEIGAKDLKNQVSVTACSHVGGHKYAGNVIIFSAGPDGKIAGNWYGYVNPVDVLELLDRQIGKGEVIERIWRGQMGAPAKEAEKVEEPTLPNGTNTNVTEKQPEEKAESVASCCQGQGANGFTCCRDENKPVKKEQGILSCWMGKLEQRPVLTTVAVVGAVATVAVAYSVYRRAR